MDNRDPFQPDLMTPRGPLLDGEDPRRSESRLRTFLGGKLVFGPQDLTADCAVRNLTTRGAKIQTSVAASLSPSVWLIIVRRGVVYRANLAWRRGDEAGLKFESEHDIATDQDPRLKIIRYVWKELTER